MVHFGRYGTYMKVWDLYDQMLRLNVMPDTVTYSYLIYVATQVCSCVCFLWLFLLHKKKNIY